MTTIVQPVRAFMLGGVTLPDPDPSLTPEQVKDRYAPNFPFLAAAMVEGPEVSSDGGTLTYTFQKAAAKTKG